MEGGGGLNERGREREGESEINSTLIRSRWPSRVQIGCYTWHVMKSSIRAVIGAALSVMGLMPN